MSDTINTKRLKSKEAAKMAIRFAIKFRVVYQRVKRPLINIILVFSLKLNCSLFFMSHRQKTRKNFENNQTQEAIQKETHFCTLSPPWQFFIYVD
jgi:hypothetical protein